MKKLLSLLLTVTMLVGTVLTVAAADGSPFSDVKTSRWSYKSIVYATIELKVTPQRDCGFDDIAKTIMMYDEVESVSLMSSGAYDLAVEVKGNDLRDVAFFVSERLATIDGILSTSTHFILKKYKEKGIFIDNEEPDERGLG